jgi:type III restriction enzyme
MAKKKIEPWQSFTFHEFLWQFYEENRKKIRSRYNDLTKKFLNFNDKAVTPTAYLRKPQFEALEMYVFIKEFMDNSQVYKIFDDWHNRHGHFDNQSYYSIDKNGNRSFFDLAADDYKNIFDYMRKTAATYPNYIYALTMGLGKTILMATCIFYEFLLMNKYPKDKKFCHNALVFAPDKTVLESLREIITFDKSKVVPHEYSNILDSNVKFYFLEEAGVTLNTLDGSDFNIIISNTQKIIKKKVHRDKTLQEQLFDDNKKQPQSFGALGDIISDLYEDDEIKDEIELVTNQRFEKLSHLQNLGIYVDEAHHLFGKNLYKSISSLRLTINELAAELSRKETNVIACYNYTGTPYTENTVLPEVVYSYGLREAIRNNFLKEADISSYENVKDTTFIKKVIRDFWQLYGGKTYEGLSAKLAIFGATIAEVTDVIKPAVEESLKELKIPSDKILVNVGDEKLTKSDDIKHFNDLDKAGTVGSEKQFILLCNKGREGWNCRSLFGVALFRSPDSTIFVLQATMRCLRQITEIQQKAIVRMSKENMDILNDELNKNFRMNIEEMKGSSQKNKEHYEVRKLKNKKIILKAIHTTYTMTKKCDKDLPVIDFGLSEEAFITKYKSYEYKKSSLTDDHDPKKTEFNAQEENRPYSLISIVAEVSNYLRAEIPCSMIQSLLENSKDTSVKISEVVSKYNKILYDRIIPYIFNALFDIERNIETEEKEVDLLLLPEGKDHIDFTALPELVVHYQNKDFEAKDGYNRVLVDKSFHTNYYCFDSKPEKECFWKYIMNDKVKEVYFTGMFTAGYNGLAIQYIDPETYAVRTYYPDFISFLEDGTIQIIEVKAENLIETAITRAKESAAAEMVNGNKIQIIEEKANPLPDFYPEDDNAADDAAEEKMQYILIPSKKISEIKI